jgi:hypothetical protein
MQLSMAVRRRASLVVAALVVSSTGLAISAVAAAKGRRATSLAWHGTSSVAFNSSIDLTISGYLAGPFDRVDAFMDGGVGGAPAQCAATASGEEARQRKGAGTVLLKSGRFKTDAVLPVQHVGWSSNEYATTWDFCAYAVHGDATGFRAVHRVIINAAYPP